MFQSRPRSGRDSIRPQGDRTPPPHYLSPADEAR
jgi:hypothetical protein